MTENKRFSLKGLIEGVPNICDNDEIIEQEEAVILLNELNDEKEIAIDGIKIADELIKKYGSEKLKHEWEKEVTVKYR